jgi:hypothetical protein
VLCTVFVAWLVAWPRPEVTVLRGILARFP